LEDVKMNKNTNGGWKKPLATSFTFAAIMGGAMGYFIDYHELNGPQMTALRADREVIEYLRVNRNGRGFTDIPNTRLDNLITKTQELRRHRDLVEDRLDNISTLAADPEVRRYVELKESKEDRDSSLDGALYGAIGLSTAGSAFVGLLFLGAYIQGRAEKQHRE
jgi:hypothetical protein